MSSKTIVVAAGSRAYTPYQPWPTEAEEDQQCDVSASEAHERVRASESESESALHAANSVQVGPVKKTRRVH